MNVTSIPHVIEWIAHVIEGIVKRSLAVDGPSQ